MVGGSWVLLHRLWISLPLSLGVVAWWLLFLVLVPAAYRSVSGAESITFSPFRRIDPPAIIRRPT